MTRSTGNCPSLAARWYGGSAPAGSQYGYAYSNPLSYIDPTGEVPLVAVAWAYARCVASCTAIDAAFMAAGMACTTLGDAAKDCGVSCLNPLNWISGVKAAEKVKRLQEKPIIIHHPSQRAARRAADRDAGMGKHGRREYLPNQELRPGSRSPYGEPGIRTEVRSRDTGKIVHYDPYGHKKGNIPPHYGVDSPNGTIHHTYPSTHNPKNNR